MMKKSVLFFLLSVLSAAACFRVKESGALWIGLAAAALFLFLAFRAFPKKVKTSQTAPARAASPAQASKPAAAQKPEQPFSYVNFSVAGVTFRNDDGTDRQTILRHIHFQDAPYVTDGSADITIQPFEYQGSPAFRILVNGYQIGFVPKNKIADVQNAVDHGAVVSGFQVTGGGSVNGEKLNYGCDIVLRYPDA